MAGVQPPSTMTEFRIPHHQGPPSRKPLPNAQQGNYQYQAYDAPRNLAPYSAVPQTTHSRTRTTSSNVLPYGSSQSQHYQNAPPPPVPQQTMVPPPNFAQSRRLSSTTTSTNSTGNQMAQGDVDIRRSASNRSANSQLGYVALMRRQKATVWCDRAQPEDARMREQARRDRKRAYLEVHGAGRAGQMAGGKIRHGGKAGLDFSPSNLVGASVPLRLSANEVGDGDDDSRSAEGAMHRRTGSGRSSLGSNHRYPSGYQRPQGTMGSNSTPPSEKTDLPEVSENTPAEIHEEEKSRVSSLVKDDAATTHTTNSSEQEDFVGDMQAPSAAVHAAQKVNKADELRRRGSVDERTTSMTNVRLFVANPDDLSD